MTNAPILIDRPDFSDHRRDGSNPWELPSWGHLLGEAIYPLFVSADRHLLPIGTAFCVSTLGIIATADHNIREAVRHHRFGDALRAKSRFPENYELDDVGLVLVHNVHNTSARAGGYTANFWPLERVHGAPPTDLVYASPRFQDSFRYSYFRLSFSVPRIGSRVTGVGYAEMDASRGPINVDRVTAKQDSWVEAYSHRFRAVETTVTHIFTQGFAQGYISGPCFVVDMEIDHGMSGGPVFREDGTVCGIMSAGAKRFFGRPAAIVSLLYPTLLSKVTFGAEMGNFRLNATQRVLDLIATGAIATDGSETLVSLREEGKEVSLGPVIHQDDNSFVFDDFRGFQEGRTATRESRETFRICWDS